MSSSQIKKLAHNALKNVVPEGFKFLDTEDYIDHTKGPVVAISTDGGTKFEKTRYGFVKGSTALKVDVYGCIGRDFDSTEQTDELQEKIRRELTQNNELYHAFGETKCSQIAALNIRGENGLRVLTHDFEVEWIDVRSGPSLLN